MWRHPFEVWTLTFLSYSEVYFLTISWNIFLITLLLVILFTGLFILKKHLLTLKRRQYMSMITEQNNQNGQDYSTILVKELEQKNYWYKIIGLCLSFLFYSFWVVCSSFYLIYYSLGKLGTGIFYHILAIIAMFLIVLIPTIIWKIKTNLKPFSEKKKQYIFTAVMCLLWLIVVILLTMQGQGVCLCSYNDNYGIIVDQGFVLSTKKSRERTLSKVCENGKICHLYATLPEKTYQQVFINVHTGLDIKKLTVILQNKKTGQHIEPTQQNLIQFTQVQQIGQRNIHSLFFENLNSSTIYIMNIWNPKTKELLKNTTYKTPPSPTDNKPVKLGIGGDVGLTKNGTSLTQLLIQYKPDIIIIGGDTAYDDAMQACYYSWDNFYWNFQSIEFALNRVIPLIMTIGNHDVGFNALSSKIVGKSISKVPYYFLYNPQHRSINQNETIPSFSNRSSTHHHIIGKTLHFHLDSGYINSYEQQALYINKISQQYPNFYKFSNYHNPIFPICADFSQGSNDMEVYSQSLQYWLPKFDQHNFIAAFEHHTHQRKFSHKLKGGIRNQNGTRYLGQGSWGIPGSSCSASYIKQDQSLYQHFQVKDANHIWQVTITQKKQLFSINYTALDIFGNIVFQKIQNLPSL